MLAAYFMKRKLLSVILVVAIIFSCNILTFAKEDTSKAKGKITRDTVITKDNLNEVLKLYGIDPSTAKASDESIDQAATTVGQIEDAIELIKQQSSKNITTDDNSSNIAISKNATGISPMSEVDSWMTLSRTTDPIDTVGLTHSVPAYFRLDTSSGNSYWTGTGTPTLIFDDKSSPGSKRKLKTINSITASNTSTTVTVNSSIDVEWYLVVGIPGTPASYDYYMSTQTIGSTINWGSSYLP
jgi:hypothetical protein